jgi:hypothetical protein
MNNNYEKLQDLTLFFKIPMGMQKNVFGNLQKIWARALDVDHQPSLRKSPYRKWKLFDIFRIDIL